MSHPPNVVISGSLAYDRIMDFPGNFTDHLMPEKLHALSVSFTVEKLTENFGGTAGNIAYTLSLLGEHPAILATGGSDFGRYREWLLKNKIGVDSVRITSDMQTSAAHIITDSANNQITGFYPGAGSIPFFSSEEETEEIGAGTLVMVAPSNLKDMETLPDICRQKNLSYLYDPGQQIPSLSGEILRKGITGAQVLFVNDYELELIKQKTDWDEKSLSDRVSVLVVTLGAKGSRIFADGKEYILPPVSIQHPVAPTGARDAHRAGFIKGLLMEFPIEMTGRLANTVAS